MQKKTMDFALLKKAQRGHEESLCALAALARDEVLAYLFRLTLDVHVAEDLCQETLMQMLKSLPKLELASERSFWAWLYKAAFSRVSHHFRNQGKTRLHHRTTADIGLLSQVPARDHSGPQALMHKELAAAIYGAMDSIGLRYRNILTLRCFQDLSYSEIAVTTGGTELQARLLFFRAKRSLRQQLAARGFKKKAQLLPALALFAASTSGQSKAAAATTLVHPATLNVSAGTFALGTATSEVGVAAMVTAAACIIVGTVGLGAFTPHQDAPKAMLERVENKPVLGPVENKVVLERVENVDATLLDLLQSADFVRPIAIGESNDNGFLRTDRSSTGPTQSGVNLTELLLSKSRQDLRAVIVPAGCWIDVRFQRSIVDGPGADILIAGWGGLGPTIEMSSAQGLRISLRNSIQFTDAQDRTILGYDLAELPQAVPVSTVRIAGTHNQGPHQGFELHEIHARVK